MPHPILHETTAFPRRLIQFVRFLREFEFLAGPGETADAFRALDVIDLRCEDDVRFALRAVLCSTRTEQAVFDDLFRLFFYQQPPDMHTGTAPASQFGQGNEDIPHDTAAPQPVRDKAVQKRSKIPPPDEKSDMPSHADASQTTDHEEGLSFLRAVRFSAREMKWPEAVHIPREGLQTMLRAADTLLHAVRLRRSRRFRPRPRGTRLHVRRTFRKNIHTGGHFITPVWSARIRKQAKFVLLCDGSRSMLTMSERFLQFACALVQRTRRAEVFLFSTGLRQVTPALRHTTRDGPPTLTQLGTEWGGGTKIGPSLQQFIRKHGSPLLTKDTLVFIFSDGLDTESPDQIAAAMKMVHTRARFVIWLNPHAAASGYEPAAQGMQAALPYIDWFTGIDDDAASYIRLAHRLRRKL